MTMTDPIADMLSRIKNANTAYHKTVSVPYSKMKESILNIFLNEGYLEDVKVEGSEPAKKNIVATLKFRGKERIISDVKRISKPSLKSYTKAGKVPLVIGGLGVSVVSTSKGIITGKEAYAQKIGGEVLCYIW